VDLSDDGLAEIVEEPDEDVLLGHTGVWWRRIPASRLR